MRAGKCDAGKAAALKLLQKLCPLSGSASSLLLLSDVVFSFHARSLSLRQLRRQMYLAYRLRSNE